MDDGHDMISNSGSFAPLNVLDALEGEYQNLRTIENQVVFLLQRCIEEATELRDALELSEELPAASVPPSRKDQESEAFKRLEEALMGASSDDDGDSSTSIP